jgi:trk system potassium uptake protein TrkH
MAVKKLRTAPGKAWNFRKSDAFYLISFFAVLIVAGAVLLSLPGADAENRGMRFVDAAFTATSAVCVTGLATVALSSFSVFGQAVILCLVQIGALGIISFTSLLAAVPGHRFSISSRNTIQGFFLNGIEYNPRRIIRSIVLLTLVIEAAGVLSLSLLFRNAGVDRPVYAGLFHGITAFCNAGISLFDDSLARFRDNNLLILVFSALITAGGAGFLVLHDLFRVITGKKRRLSYHSLVVIGMSVLLSAGGGLFFAVFEAGRVYGDLGFWAKLNNAVFHAVAARTAGFQSALQTEFTGSSRLLTTVLMFIGGAPGSVAGGLKVTTIFVIAAVMMRKPDFQGDIRIRHHRLSTGTINRAVSYFLKVVSLLAVFVFALSVTELRTTATLEQIVFETVSAFATAGLTLELTPHLTTAGKVVVIAAMFAGRVGLVALAFPSVRHKNYAITYSEGELLL